MLDRLDNMDRRRAQAQMDSISGLTRYQSYHPDDATRSPVPQKKAVPPKRRPLWETEYEPERRMLDEGRI